MHRFRDALIFQCRQFDPANRQRFGRCAMQGRIQEFSAVITAFDQPFFGADDILGAQDFFAVFAMGADFFNVFGENHMYTVLSVFYSILQFFTFVKRNHKFTKIIIKIGIHTP